MKHHDYTYITTVCTKCGSEKILRDNHRKETYCTHCGLILQDNTIFQIGHILTEEQEKNKRINQFWKKTNSSFMGDQKKESVQKKI